ncbi:MAG: hypothetical protein RJQ01_08265 [Microcella sp.]|uniref:zinc ribbon domain-containing protein n=1 Tax=Microcella sp. TaxID=1913979 RepID=UPI003314BBBA
MALTAPRETQALLLDLQAFDTHLQQLAYREKTLPERDTLEAVTGEAEAVRTTLVDARGELDDSRTELGRVESDVDLVEKRIARDTDRLQSSSSVKDIQGLEHEVASLRTRLSDLEEIQLAVMERVEVLELTVQAAEAQHRDHAERLAAAQALHDAALSALHAERAEVLSQRETLSASIPADLLALYEKQRERYGVGASHLRARVSSASGVELTGSDLEAVRTAAPDAVLLCPDSNAILVRTGESGL